MHRSVAAREAQIAKMLQELHASYLKGNEYDEGDPIFYHINYRLADAFGLTREGPKNTIRHITGTTRAGSLRATAIGARV